MLEHPISGFFIALYQWIIRWSGNFQSLFLFLLRLIWGHQFIRAGIAKFFRIEQTTQFFTDLGIAYPDLIAPFLARIEFACGLLLFIGLGSRLAAFPLIFAMATAIHVTNSAAFAHLYSDPSILAEAPAFPYLLTALLVFLFGPGRISFDAWIKHHLAQYRLHD